MKLLLAYNGMDHGQAALEESARVAAENDGAEITIFSVISSESTPLSHGYVPVAPHAHLDVATAHEYLKQHGGIEAETKVSQGDPAEEIVREARAGHYDMIVTGTHGRGPIGRLVFGSVSRQVAEHAPCTVLIVSPDHRVRVEPRVFVEPRAG